MTIQDMHSNLARMMLTNRMPCGGNTEFDYGGYGYRCTDCGAVIGSIAMPTECVKLLEMQLVVDKIKGRK